MAEAVELKADERKSRGSRQARKLRKQKLVPAVVYGHKQATESVTIPGDELDKAIRHGVRVVDLRQAAGVQKALIRAVQWDPMGHDILHVDFTRVDVDERITLEVRIELRRLGDRPARRRRRPGAADPQRDRRMPGHRRA